eukprot:TRINITY_DN1088_c0_g1_i4.p1 TRINITY_DN1088_c0_g1~~TRINITY_DN1088_c0_g1_i4.p1  ORF type:complete len:463 (+),score=67.83 TRINITY_DN1088_c0_g1_i4:50-1390(+)
MFESRLFDRGNMSESRLFDYIANGRIQLADRRTGGIIGYRDEGYSSNQEDEDKFVASFQSSHRWSDDLDKETQSLTTSCYLVQGTEEEDLETEEVTEDLFIQDDEFFQQVHRGVRDAKKNGFIQLLDRKEPWEFVALRCAAYTQTWRLMLSEVEQHQAGNVRVKKLLAQLREESVIPTIALISGATDQGKFLDELSREIGQESDEPELFMARLQPKRCTTLAQCIDTLIKQYVVQTEGRTIPGKNLDILLLYNWYLRISDSSKKKVLVVAIEDFECFTDAVLIDLFNILGGDHFCGQSTVNIPFTLILGLSSSDEAIHRMLPQSIISSLDIYTISLGDTGNFLEDTFRRIVLNGHIALNLGPKVWSSIFEEFRFFGGTMASLQSHLQYVVMYHFFNQPLSFLCGLAPDRFSIVLSALNSDQLQHLAGLPSLQSIDGQSISSWQILV